MIDNSKMMIGEHFTYRGIEWICLDIIDGKNGDVSHDLYSPKAEIYVFGYNDSGSIATYHITEKDAMELSDLANKNDDLWDDPSYENYSEGETTNLDRCEELLEFGDWVDTRNFNKSSGVVM